MSDYLQAEKDRLKQKIAENQALLSDPELGKLAQTEIISLTEQLSTLESSVPSPLQGEGQGEVDGIMNSPAIVEVRSAAGGDEAQIFADDLTRMYLRFATNNNFDVSQIDSNVLRITKKSKTTWNHGAYKTFAVESGVHRVQRVPETENAGRIHTSTATVAVLPILPSTAIEIKPVDLEWQFTTAGGPGGQNVNKVNTAVRLTHKPSGIVVAVREERFQERNKTIALEVLRSKLWEIAEQERIGKLESQRIAAVGRGMRSEKIKTYNFPQNRLTDHRLGKSWYSLKEIIEGDLADVLEFTLATLPAPESS